jgi:large subunit ribosomal protein L31e
VAKKEQKAKPVLERNYNIPLRKEFLKVARYKRTNRAASSVRSFLVRHMKSDNVRLGPRLNMKLWERGIRNPPHHINVTAVKYEEGNVKAELVGFPVEAEKKEEKKDKKAEPAKKDAKPEKSKEPAKKEPGQAEAKQGQPKKTGSVKEEVKPKDKSKSPESSKVGPEAEKQSPELKKPVKEDKQEPLEKEPAEKTAKAEPKTSQSKKE